MIEALSASVGLLARDPMFWMPLVLFGLVVFLLAGQIVLDGFDVGCGLMMPWLDSATASRVIDALTAWRGASESWILLLFAIFMAAFPLGWVPVTADLFVPLLLLVTGSVVRSLAFEFRARASMGQQRFWNAMFSLGAHCSVAGLGLWLAMYVSGPSQDLDDWVFVILVLMSVSANCVLLASCWILTWDAGPMRQKAAKAGAASIRWVAAGMVAVSLILALTNPAIYYRWTHSESLHVGIGSWLMMLSVFVYLERALRLVAARPEVAVWWTPLVAVAALNVMMLLGLVYSYFPFLVLDELTVWDAAASRESLRWVMAAAVAAAPILLVFNVMGYWRLFRYKPVRTTV